MSSMSLIMLQYHHSSILSLIFCLFKKINSWRNFSNWCLAFLFSPRDAFEIIDFIQHSIRFISYVLICHILIIILLNIFYNFHYNFPLVYVLIRQVMLHLQIFWDFLINFVIDLQINFIDILWMLILWNLLTCFMN